MTLLHPFNGPSGISINDGFDSPFCNSPSRLATHAAELLKKHLESYSWGKHDFFSAGNGQIFGVLVVRKASGSLANLYGFTGAVGEQWQWPDFVPPAFDQELQKRFLPRAKQQLQQWQKQIIELQNNAAYVLAQQKLEMQRVVLKDATESLHAELVERRALRRSARQGADERTLALLLKQGEADARLRSENKHKVREQLRLLELPVKETEEQLAELQKKHHKLSVATHHRVMESYSLPNAQGEHADLQRLFAGREPLSGIGDCAGPKLLAYAYRQGLQPVAMAEFWWGAEPHDQVRHHKHFYPSCRGRCVPLLTFMLQGLPVGRQPEHLRPFADPLAPEIIYEDNHLILVNKPAGLLSVPGLAISDSVQSRLQAMHPDKPELQLVHRLDQSTSGLLLIAKTRRDHKALQRQFTGRTIRKQYIALVDGVVRNDDGEIDLPLRVDLEDRPRQLVCYQHGKPALTQWRVLDRQAAHTRVALSPVTGRTHQLRVHMAHALGLAMPIVGDELYGKVGSRLHLHAESLSFIHPGSGEVVDFKVPAPF